jgi:aspartate-semialdehyde dehydrogenase
VKKTLAIVGATGAVGREMLLCLEQRRFPVKELRLLASARSAGAEIEFRGEKLKVEELTAGSFAGVEIALFAATTGVAKEFAPIAARAGCVVIDNSSAFRADPGVPLVVPRINPEALEGHGNILANPNCSTIISLLPLNVLHEISPLSRVIAATYQAASGAGAEAMEELRESTRAALDGKPFTPKVLPHPYGFNIFSHDSDVDPETGYNGEERKLLTESRKILGVPELRVSATCVRVPVLRAHSVAIHAEFRDPISVEHARAALAGTKGIEVVDDREANLFPMPVAAAHGDGVLVGRIRADLSDPTGRTLALFVAGDQLRIGAALNAVEIAELLLEEK